MSADLFDLTTRSLVQPSTSRSSERRMSLRVLVRVDAMLLAVVFERQHLVLPAHVEVIPPTAVGAAHRYLRAGSRKTRAESQAAAARFPSATRRRGRTGPSAELEPRKTSAIRDDARPTRRISPALEARGVAECVEIERPPYRAADDAPRSKAVRAGVVTRIPSISPSSSARIRKSYVRMPAAGRAFGQISSIGSLSSTQFAPCSADAVNPAMTP